MQREENGGGEYYTVRVSWLDVWICPRAYNWLNEPQVGWLSFVLLSVNMFIFCLFIHQELFIKLPASEGILNVFWNIKQS